MHKTVASLALLKVNWDTLRKDYIENFVPFAVTLMNQKNYGVIDVNTVCRDFKAEYGLLMSYHPMIAVLQRAMQRGYITKRKGDGQYVPIMERVAVDDFTGVAIDQERKYKKAINEFLQFCEENYGETLSEEEAEVTFISFLKDHDLDILFINQSRDTLLPEANVSTAQRFLMNSFVKKAYEAEPEVFSFIVDMSVGHVISSTLLCQDYEKFQGKLVGGNFYLDIGFLFSIMGIDGPEKEEAYIECIRLLSSHKASLFVFRHTYDEFMGILESCLQWIESASFDPLKASRSLIYFIDNGFTASDVERFILSVDQKLSELGIAVAETPDPSKDQIHQVDEERLQELIVEVYQDRDPHFDEEEKDRTLYRDVKSISAVYKMRKGHKPKRLSEARFVFVTTNSSLAYVSRLFETEQFDHSYFSIPTQYRPDTE